MFKDCSPVDIDKSFDDSATTELSFLRFEKKSENYFILFPEDTVLVIWLEVEVSRPVTLTDTNLKKWVKSGRLKDHESSSEGVHFP